MATFISTVSRLVGKRSTPPAGQVGLVTAALRAMRNDPFETDPNLRAVRETVRTYVAACRAARARTLGVERRADAALRRTAAV